jgi:hypothetical protein
LGAFATHFLLIVAGAVAAVTEFIGNGNTALPASAQGPGKSLQRVADAALGRNLQLFHPLRQGLTAYLHCAGIDSGYTFFAPTVPNSYKVVFEIHYPDGRIEYELPEITHSAASFRLSTMMHYAGKANYDGLREVMLKMMTYQIAHRHPKATRIRTILGCIDEPTSAEAVEGKTESYHTLYAYDFNLTSETLDNSEQ